MRTCEACGRDFTGRKGVMTCAYCGYNICPLSRWPRTEDSMQDAEERRQEDGEVDLDAYLQG